MWITWWKSVEKNLTLTHKMLGFVLKSRWDIEFKHLLFTATIHCQKDVGNDKNTTWEREDSYYLSLSIFPDVC